MSTVNRMFFFMFFPPEVVMEAVHVGKPTDEWYPWGKIV